MNNKGISLTLTKVINTILVVCPFIACWFLYYEPITMTKESAQVSVLVILVYSFIFYSLVLRLDGFRASVKKVSEQIYAQIVAAGLTDLCAVVGIWMLSIHFPNLWPGFLCFLGQCAVIPFICWWEYREYYKYTCCL